MILTDRFTRGFLAGLIGGVVSLIWGLISKFILHLSDLLFGEFAAVLIYGRPAVSLGDHIFAQITVFGFYGICGIIFVFFIPYMSSRNLYLKGAIWGVSIWFFAHAVTILFKVPGLMEMNLSTLISQFIGGLLWGVFLVLTLKLFAKRVK